MSVFKLPSKRLRKSLGNAQATYSKQIASAAGFLKERGINLETAHKWGLGVVASPTTSHEHVEGRLAVPYFNAKGEVYGFTFRCILHDDCQAANCKKYLQPLGQTTLLYNVGACDDPGQTIHVTEGELDCIVLAECLGEPAVGVSGRDKWAPHWPTHFVGWERVLLWPDGDKAGREMAAMWGKRINCEVVEMGKGLDVTKVFVEFGVDALKRLAGGNDDDWKNAGNG